jgi:hypothetical protein
VIAASRALTTPAAHARTTNSSSSSPKTGIIAWQRLTPARFTASTKSARPVNFRNGRKFDTTQNKDDLAHLPSRDSKNAKTLAPSAPPSSTIPRSSRNTR